VAPDPNACGLLRYGRYTHQGEMSRVHRLPDFSYAGYKRGGVAIPAAEVRVTLSPAQGDSLARIQAAIDQVSALPLDASGLRGAVLLRQGEYRVSDTLRIRQSGVVIRGEGQGNNGTVLTFTRRAKHPALLAGRDAQREEVANTRVAITDDVVPVGARTFSVTDAAGFSPGDFVVVIRTPNDRWINTLNMARYGWTPRGFTIAHERRVVAVSGNALTVDIPIVDAMTAQYGGGAVALAATPERISQVGVEDLRLVSVYSGASDEAHAWDGVVLRHVEDSWVRRVTVRHFGYSAVSALQDSAFNTIEEVAMLDPVSQIDGGRRYSFYVDDAIGTLFQRCFSTEGRHNFVTGSRATGPNVWLDSLAINNHNDEGPHHRWATGLLFDNIKSDQLNVQNRGGSGSNDDRGHGWAGAQVMFWNTRANTMICDSPTGAKNWAVGAFGSFEQSTSIREEPCQRIASGNNAARVGPRSLYLRQLQDRLGAAAVEAVTSPAQRAGRIWQELEQWAGRGRL
jgi:hypothetical protein